MNKTIASKVSPSAEHDPQAKAKEVQMSFSSEILSIALLSRDRKPKTKLETPVSRAPSGKARKGEGIPRLAGADGVSWVAASVKRAGDPGQRERSGQ